MMGRHLLRRRSESGQAAVESAIVFPGMIFMLLGILQLTMMQQARLMTEFAAYQAARAGIVNSLRKADMVLAAEMALIPTRPSIPYSDSLLGSLGLGGLPDDLLKIAEQALIVHKVLNPLSKSFFDKEVISVDILNPTKADFNGKDEIEFDATQDGFAVRRQSQLTIRLTYFFPLRIPFANWLLFESWLAAQGGIKLVGWDPAHPKINYGSGPLSVGIEWPADVRLAMELQGNKTPNCYNGISSGTMTRLAIWAATGNFYFPLVTTHTMRMQSNPFNTDGLLDSPPDCSGG